MLKDHGTPSHRKKLAELYNPSFFQTATEENINHYHTYQKLKIHDNEVVFLGQLLWKTQRTITRCKFHHEKNTFITPYMSCIKKWEEVLSVLQNEVMGFI
jgi:hypothetical protein